ncbi:hypothetical protein QE152_g10716 [Popillia japonica]|uniref:Uncharacterized protein n=1 Tax=Popillia japonica TaxID=7064 RepID=A0AAW1LQH2_POPJA
MFIWLVVLYKELINNVFEPSRPPVRLRLPQISLQELKTIRVAIKRKDVPPDAAVTGPLIRSLDDPEDLILHKPGR